MTTIIHNASARSLFFQLGALGLSHPVPEFHQLLERGDYRLGLAQAAIDGFGTRCMLAQQASEFTHIEAAYIDLFHVGHRGKPRVYLNAGDYESVSRDHSRPEVLLQYTSWYKYFGLQTNDGDEVNELPDHITCQLEFMSWLTHLESTASEKPDLLEGYQCAQRDFCSRHLQPFLKLLVSSLQKNEQLTVDNRYLELAIHICDIVDSLVNEFVVALDDLPGPDKRVTAVNLWD